MTGKEFLGEAFSRICCYSFILYPGASRIGKPQITHEGRGETIIPEDLPNGGKFYPRGIEGKVDVDGSPLSFADYREKSGSPAHVTLKYGRKEDILTRGSQPFWVGKNQARVIFTEKSYSQAKAEAETELTGNSPDVQRFFPKDGNF